MYADRNNRSSGLDPRSLGIAVAINGTLVAALLASHPEYVVRNPGHLLKTYNIPIPPLPQPPPPRPVEHQQAPRQSVDAPRPIVDLPVPINPVVTSEVVVPVPLPSATGITIVPEATPTPALVTIGPEIDPAHSGDLQPTYPASELRAEREGIVTVRVLVGIDGRVRQVDRVAATSDAFFLATQDQARRRWRFRPATRGSVPVEAWRQMTIRFVIPR